MLVSLHLPKTAGSSFRLALQECFGDRFYADYEDKPLNAARWPLRVRALYGALAQPDRAQFRERRIECVHGHFLPLKYRPLRASSGARFVTWLREPTERLLSHYYYWRETPLPPDAGQVRRRFDTEGWSLERFCAEPALRNLYTRFLWGFPLRYFDFVGLTEHYDADLRFFCDEVLQQPLRSLYSNATPGAARQRARETLNPELAAKIRHWHAADYRLYRRAQDMRAARTGAG